MVPLPSVPAFQHLARTAYFRPARIKGLHAVVRAPPWTTAAPILQSLHLVSIAKRCDLKLLLLTSWCIQSGSLLCDQFNFILPSNSTHHTTQSQTFHTLCIPPAYCQSGTLSPLYTSALLWNNLPSDLRSPNLSFPQIRRTLLKYLGYPVLK